MLGVIYLISSFPIVAISTLSKFVAQPLCYAIDCMTGKFLQSLFGSGQQSLASNDCTGPQPFASNGCESQPAEKFAHNDRNKIYEDRFERPLNPYRRVRVIHSYGERIYKLAQLMHGVKIPVVGGRKFFGEH